MNKLSLPPWLLKRKQQHQLTDHELLHACVHPDQTQRLEALESLFTRYQQHIYRQAYSITRNRDLSLDIVQSVAMTMMQHVGRVRQPDKFYHWLMITTKRAAWRHLKRTQRRSQVESRWQPGAGSLTTPFSFHDDLLQELNRLPDRYSHVLKLRYFDGLTVVDISQRLGKPMQTVKTRLHRGLERLRQSMGRRGALSTGTTLAILETQLVEARQIVAPELCQRAFRAALSTPGALSSSWWSSFAGAISFKALCLLLGTAGALLLYGNRPEKANATVQEAPVVAGQTIAQQNQQLLEEKVIPELLQALRTIVLGGEVPTVQSVEWKGTQATVTLMAQHRVTKKTPPLFSSRMRITADTQHGATRFEIDEFNKGAFRIIRPYEAIRLFQFNGKEAMSIRSQALTQASGAFTHLLLQAPDLVPSTSTCKPEDIERTRPFLGQWYANGLRERPYFFYLADDGTIACLDENAELSKYQLRKEADKDVLFGYHTYHLDEQQHRLFIPGLPEWLRRDYEAAEKP